MSARLAAVAATIARAGWNAARVEVAAADGAASGNAGPATLPAIRAPLAAEFAVGDGFVVPAARRTDVAVPSHVPGDLVFVPLARGDDVLGSITVVGPASPERVSALCSLGAVLALAVHTERRLERAAGDAERAAVITRVSESIRSSLDREEILRAVARDVRLAFGSARCAIYVRDERDPGLARVIAADDPGSEREHVESTCAIAGTLLTTCLGLGQVVRIERNASAADQAQLVPFGVASILLVPFVVDGKIDAGLSIQYAQPRVFDERDVLLMQTIAQHVGLALANSRLYERERSARRRAEDIERNVRALKETRSVVEILQLLLDMIAREYDLNGSAWSIENGRLTCRVLTARPSAEPTVGDTADDALGALEGLAERDVVPIPAGVAGPWAAVVGDRGGFALPLRLDERLLGLLAFDGVPLEGDRDDRDAFLRTVAAHGALALANAAAFEAERRFAQESAAISEAGRVILAHSELESLAEAMCRCAIDLAAADRAALYVSRDGRLQRAGAIAYDGGAALPATLTADDPLVHDALAGGASTIGRRSADERTLVVPLRAGAGARIAGVYVCVRSGAQAKPFDRGTVRLLEALGALVALGLRNVELYGALAENNEFKDDLLAMFTHDFKGPLTVIQGYTELLLEDAPEPARANIETIYRQSLRLAKLAEDALVLTRTQAAGFSLQRAVCDLNDFVGESVDAHDPPGARIAFERPADPTWVSIDRTRLKHVVDNVIANALKYSTEAVDVRVACGGDEAVVHVTDRGIGIPDDEHERIFARFGRGSNARVKGIAGTGVGLYVARKIVEVHGGRIGVQSRVNEGSTFSIAIPLVPTPVPAGETTLSAP